MVSIENQPFWEKLNISFKGNIKTLITKTKIVNFYKEAQLKGSIVIILIFLIYYFLNVGNHSFDNIFESFGLYLCVFGVGGYFALLEKIMEPLRKEIGKLTETIRTQMIIKICNCNGYCECKEDLNNYMKVEKGIRII